MKEKTKFYYLSLPKGYVAKKTIDAKEKKTAILFTLLSFVILAAVIAILLFTRRVDFDLFFSNSTKLLIADAALIGTMILYIIIHELTHGIGYKLFTREKLKFGVTLTCAFCGVPNSYVKKWPAFITTLLPFFTYSCILFPLYYLTSSVYVQVVSGFILALHLSGCIGDLTVAGYLLLKADKSTLVNDDGAKQVFYEYSEEKYKEDLEKENEGNISTESQGL